MFYRIRRQLNVLVALGVLGAALYGGVKLWMYHNAKQAMEELSVAAAGRADIRYEGIETELAGAVRVRGVTLLPAGAPQPVRIDQVRVSGPDLPFFLWGQGGQRQPPARLRVDIDGIRVSLDPALFAALQEGMTLPGESGTGACGPADELDPELLRELGFSELLVDASFSYDFDEPARRMDADLSFDVQRIQRMEMRLSLDDVDPDALQGGMSAVPTVASMAMEFHIDPDFGNRYLAACAQRRGQNADNYREILVDQTLSTLSTAGLQLGVGLTQAVRDYHQRWGSLHISANPPSPVNPMMLMFSPPENWQRQLGLRVKLNNVDVPDLGFELRPPDPDELAILMGKEPPPSKPRKPRPRYRYVYRSEPVSGLASHVGAEVRLYLRDQPMRAGVLVSVEGTEARVEQRLHGGKITAHVALADIERLEVREVEKIPAK